MPIYKRGGIYWISVSNGRQRIRRTAGKNATREQAKEIESQILADLHANKLGKKPRRLISEAMNKWLDGECKSLKSEKKFGSHANALLPYISGKYLDQCGSVADDMKRTMKASPATINRRLAIIRRVANLAYESWDWLDNAVAHKIKMLQEHNTRHVYLTHEDVEKLARAASYSGDAVRLAAYTGLRRSELLGLKPDNLRDGCIILDSKTKSGRPRVIPLPTDVTHITLPVSTSNAMLRKHWDKARKETGLTHIRFHDLRHTYASWLLRAGAPVHAVRDLMGHADLSVTSRYAHLLDEHLKDAVRKIGGGGGI